MFSSLFRSLFFAQGAVVPSISTSCDQSQVFESCVVSSGKDSAESLVSDEENVKANAIQEQKKQEIDSFPSKRFRVTYELSEQQNRVEEEDLEGEASKQNDIFNQRFLSKEAVIASITKSAEFGVQKNLTYDNSYRGGSQFRLRCQSCSEFCLNVRKITNKKELGLWKVSTTSQLLHKSLNENNQIIPCLGVRNQKTSSKDLLNDPSVYPLLARRTPLKQVREIANSKNLECSDDVIKKASVLVKKYKCDITRSLENLQPFLEEFKLINPDAEVEFKVDENGVFQYCVVILPTAKVVAEHVHLLGLDAAHFKSVQTYSSDVLEKHFVSAASTYLPGNHLHLLGFMIHLSETSRDYEILLDKLLKVGNFDREDVIVVSDRGGAVNKSINNSFIHSFHMFCAIHLLRNLEQFKTLNTFLFWSARNATTLNEYLKSMDEIKKQCRPAYNYLISIENWQLYKIHDAGVRCYGSRSSNVIEQIFGLIKEERKLLPYDSVIEIIQKFQILTVTLHKKMQKDNNVLSEFSRSEFQESWQRAIESTYNLKQVGEFEWTYKNQKSQHTYVINIEQACCSCGHMFQVILQILTLTIKI